ncbi:acetolactate decarboxylase [Brevibacillus sp. M2.1A]|uniref:acetolactate decarboxylase n=1 Tax=Brevibacillus sp. M2.1A TaxID=2738980 RepID=UPI00156AA683|nr:acetolactate decarboxylase [Brevibacillus sp. M2.1A]MCC8433450.1 acetolactate decarboxylase [Brevibacillus sp. M2.1A]
MKKNIITSITSLALVAGLSLTAFAATTATVPAPPAKQESKPAVAANPAPKNVLFQYSTINALMLGQFEGDLTLKDLKLRGDMGLGTINDLDGEMIQMGTKFYQIDSTGKLSELPESVKTPFAVTTHFEPKEKTTLTNVQDYNQLTKMLEEKFENKNVFYAVKLTGTFKMVKARTVPKQTRPYPQLTEVTKKQSEFEFKNVKGTLIGFYTPNYAAALNVPGFHLHFITEDKTGGGHVLNLQFDNANLEISPIHEFDVQLPHTDDFAHSDLTQVTTSQVHQAESERK